ncbi:MAG TPA: VOC family protein, partial [Acidimicrobiales bacterium]|nr:VOC family protein [Acidimicrobiales bacterium]
REGTVRAAVFELGGRRVMAIDSDGPHAFTFTPAISMWVDCSSEEELDKMSTSLGEGGSFLMPVGDYGFSRRFCWVADRYGVTWQLNLA